MVERGEEIVVVVVGVVMFGRAMVTMPGEALVLAWNGKREWKRAKKWEKRKMTETMVNSMGNKCAKNTRISEKYDDVDHFTYMLLVK